MSFLLAVTAVATSLRPVQATGPRPKLFTAFAARRPEEAVEKPMPDGRVHGIFTWTLLQALDGKVPFEGDTPAPGAVDITTARIKNFLITAMRKHLTAAELRDDTISREPDFGSDDPMVFGTVAAGGGFKVVLSFPGSAPGTPFTLLGDGLQQVAAGQVAATPTELTLGVGMYAAVVAGTTKTFEVVGDTDVAVG